MPSISDMSRIKKLRINIYGGKGNESNAPDSFLSPTGFEDRPGHQTHPFHELLFLFYISGRRNESL